MIDPLAPPCGHAACERCLIRAVDLRRECAQEIFSSIFHGRGPYCRSAVTCAQLVSVTCSEKRKKRRSET